MKVRDVNRLLLGGQIDSKGLFPHLEARSLSPFVFRFGFGLDQLPTEPGPLLIRGPRQYGKSTWLEGHVRPTLERFLLSEDW